MRNLVGDRLVTMAVNELQQGQVKKKNTYSSVFMFHASVMEYYFFFVEYKSLYILMPVFTSNFTVDSLPKELKSI